MVNHDMIANSNENPATWRVRLMPYEGSMPQSDYAVQQTEEFTTLNAVFGSANSASSDSYPFWQKGYPVIYFFEYEFCPYYHSDLDITANLNPTYCAEVIRASIASTAVLLDDACYTAKRGSRRCRERQPIDHKLESIHGYGQQLLQCLLLHTG
jgi:hypothetical protein